MHCRTVSRQCSLDKLLGQAEQPPPQERLQFGLSVVVPGNEPTAGDAGQKLLQQLLHISMSQMQLQSWSSLWWITLWSHLHQMGWSMEPYLCSALPVHWQTWKFFSLNRWKSIGFGRALM
jgi:hypothetical protein